MADLAGYMIRGGAEGRARLGVLADVLAPTTAALLDRAGPLAGRRVVDVACGGGDVAMAIAGRVGPKGTVTGLDLDPVAIGIAGKEAAARGLANIRFTVADVTAPWPVEAVDLVYARFILTHLRDPAALLAQAHLALASGGMILVEDIDYAGRFSDPPSAALERGDALYVQAVEAHGGDPFIGRRLDRLLAAAGFADIGVGLVQPFGRSGNAKRMAGLTFAAIASKAVAAGLATTDEVARLGAEIDAFTARPDTAISMPRIFQAWGRPP